MGTNSLTTRASGEVILDSFFNDFNTALGGSFVGRNTSGVPTSGQDLGTAAIPWGQIRGSGLSIGGATVDTSAIASPVNRVISGAVRTTSNQPQYIVPNGAALSFQIAASTTHLVFDVNGTTITASTNITKSSLTAAAASAASMTCALNDSDAAGQFDTRHWGNFWHKKQSLTVNSMGAAVSALVGKWATFKTSTEYFLAYIESTTKLSRIERGYYYNSSLAPLNPVALTNADVFLMVKTGWIFLDDDGTTVDVTYNCPTKSYTAPSSPATGDYWYDYSNSVWKRYDGASWESIGRTLVGMFVNDATNCVAARSVDFYDRYEADLELDLEVTSNTVISSANKNVKINVAGNEFDFRETILSWDITSNLATSADMINSTEQASTLYHLYLSDQGKPYISDIHPQYRPDMKGWYHPHNPWRAVGLAWNDGSSNLVGASVRGAKSKSEIIYDGSSGWGSTDTKIKWLKTRQKLQGAAVYDTSETTLGTKYIINESGYYTVVAGHARSANATTVAITVDDTARTTNASGGLTYAQGARGGYLGGATANAEQRHKTWTGWLDMSQIVRMHGDGETSIDDSSCWFSIARVG